MNSRYSSISHLDSVHTRVNLNFFGEWHDGGVQKILLPPSAKRCDCTSGITNHCVSFGMPRIPLLSHTPSNIAGGSSGRGNIERLNTATYKVITDVMSGTMGVSINVHMSTYMRTYTYVRIRTYANAGIVS